MRDSAHGAEWFLGGILALALLQYLFSASGGALLVSVLRLGRVIWPIVPMDVFASAWLTVGLVVAFVVFTLGVGLLRAPGRIWYVALALSLLKLGAIVGVIAPFVLTGAGRVLFTSSVWAGVASSPYGSGQNLVAAVVGYVFAALLGCGLGVLVRRKPDVTAPHA